MPLQSRVFAKKNFKFAKFSFVFHKLFFLAKMNFAKRSINDVKFSINLFIEKMQIFATQKCKISRKKYIRVFFRETD